MKIFASILALFAAAALSGQPLTISTGAGYAGQGTNDGLGAAARFFNPQGVAVDAVGNVYVADTGNNTIRVITPGGVSSTLAGVPGVAGSGDGTGSGATFNQPTGITLDSATNLYVTDFGSSTIREVTLSGEVTTIAGTAGVTGSANNTGTNALFFHPMGIAADRGGNLYVADYGNQLIREITTAHVVSTFAGQAGVVGTTNGAGTGASALFNEPEGVTVDAAGNVYVADTGNAAIRMITPAGAVSTLAGSPGALGSIDGVGSNALFYQPVGIAISASSNLYVADAFYNTLRQVSPDGTVLTIAGLPGTSGNIDGAGSLARFSGPQGLAIDPFGTLYIADTVNSTIRRMNGSSMVSTLAGSASAASSNGMTTSARLYFPENLAADASNNVYVADTQNSVIRQISPAGAVSILAGMPGVFGSVDGAAANASFNGPQGVAVVGSGNVYVADTGNSTIRKISGGATSTFAGSPGNPGNADGSGPTVQFYEPQGVAVDGSGNVYVADTWNHTIRKLTPGGASTTLAGMADVFGSFDGAGSAARFNNPSGITVDGGGNLYVTDCNNDTIRKITSAGVVTTIAGLAGTWGANDGAGAGALFFQPAGISLDGSGNLYIVDSGNGVIRKLSPSGTNWTSSTVAGTDNTVGASDGAGAAAQFNYPTGVAVNSAGYVFVADSGNNTIRTTKAIATMTWPAPAPVVYGTALSGAQLNASSTVPGPFAYTPPPGAVLNTGTNVLTATLTPTDTTDYSGISGSVSLAVTPATLTVTANNAARSVGVANPTFTGTIAGLVNGDNITATYATSATPSSPAGTYPIIPTLVDPGDRETNYVVDLVDGTLTVGLVQAGAFQSISALPNGAIQFNLTGTSGATYTLDVSTDLISWSPLMTFSMTNGAVQVVDATATNYPHRYYMLASP